MCVSASVSGHERKSRISLWSLRLFDVWCIFVAEAEIFFLWVCDKVSHAIKKLQSEWLFVKLVDGATASLASLHPIEFYSKRSSSGCLTDVCLRHSVKKLMNEQRLTWERMRIQDTCNCTALFSTLSPSQRRSKNANAKCPYSITASADDFCPGHFSCQSRLHFLRPLHAYGNFLDWLSTSGHKMLLDFSPNPSLATRHTCV